MTEILAIAAFFIAFGTVFLVNDALRKIERKHDASVKSLFNQLRADLDKNIQIVREAREELDALKDATKGQNEKSLQLKVSIGEMEDKLELFRSDLAAIDRDSKIKKGRKRA